MKSIDDILHLFYNQKMSPWIKRREFCGDDGIVKFRVTVQKDELIGEIMYIILSSLSNLLEVELNSSLIDVARRLSDEDWVENCSQWRQDQLQLLEDLRNAKAELDREILSVL